MSRRRELRLDITGSARGGVQAITTMQRNLKNLSRVYKDLARQVDLMDKRANRFNKSTKRIITPAMRSLRGHMGELTKNMQRSTQAINTFESAWRKGFIDTIEKSGMSIDEFNRRQGEKDAAMDKNVQSAQKGAGAIGKFRDTITNAGSKLENWGNSIRSAGNRLVGMGRQLSSAGRQMLFFAGILAGGAREMIGDLGDFSTTLNDIQGAMLLNMDAGENLGETFDALRDEIVRVGDAYNYSEADMAKLAQAMISGGMSGTEALGMLDQAAMFARANMLDMAEAGELIVRSLIGMKQEGQDTTHILDLLTAVGAKTTESLDSIRAAIGFSLTSSEKFRDSQEQVVASLVHLIGTGESATVAGRRIQGMFENLVVNADDLGFSIVGADGSFLSFFDIISRFRIKLSEMGTEFEKASYLTNVFGQNQVNTMLKLINAEDELGSMTAALENVSGATETLATIHMTGFEESVSDAQSTWKDFMLDIEESVVGPLTDLIDAFTELLENEELKKFISDLAGAFASDFVPALGDTIDSMIELLGAFGITGEEAGEGLASIAAKGLVLGPGLLGLGMAFEALGGTLNIVGSLIGGVGSWTGVGIVAALAVLGTFLASEEGAPYLEDLKTAAGDLYDKLMEPGGLVPTIIDLITNLGKLLGPVVSEILISVLPVITVLVDALTTVLGWINRILEGMATLVGAELEARDLTERRVRLQMQAEYRAAHPEAPHGRGGEPIPINEDELIRRVTEERIRLAQEAKDEGGISTGGWIGLILGGILGGLAGGPAGAVIGAPLMAALVTWIEEKVSGGQHGGRVMQGGLARIHKDEHILTPTQQANVRGGFGMTGGDITINLTVDSSNFAGDPYESGQRLGEGIADSVMARTGRSMRV